jgi:hypothetical protein
MSAALKLFDDLGIIYYAPNRQHRRDLHLATCCDRFVGRLIEQRGLPHVVVTLRCICESEGNSNALISDIISAISDIVLAHPRWPAMGLAFIEAFDRVNLLNIRKTARAANVQPLRVGIATLVAIELAKILGPSRPPKAPKPLRIKREPKPPLSVTRIPRIEKNIALGVELLALRATVPGNAPFGREVRKRFPGVDNIEASQAMRVAKMFSSKPEIYRSVGWRALVELASPKMSQALRQRIEADILAGRPVSAPQIRRARAPLKGGSPKRRPVNQSATSLAA